MLAGVRQQNVHEVYHIHRNHRYSQLTRYSSSSRLITPPRLEDEVYPYRRVWPSIIIELSGIFGVAFVLYVASGFLGITLPESLQQPINILIALLPAVLWLATSYWRERRVPEPRRGILGVFIISGLVANAIALPLINAINPGEWLSLSPLVSRIIGNMVTFGVIHEFSKYIILRYTIWPQGIRERPDAIAYSAAATIGYVTVINLAYVLSANVSSDAAALNVFATTGTHIAAGMVISYGLAQSHFNPRSFLLTPFTLIMAAAIHGISITMRANFTNSGFFLGIAGTRPLFGLIIAVVLVVGILFIMAFLFNNAERQSREADSA